MGLEMDSSGALWFVDGPGNSVGRVVVEVPCEEDSGVAAGTMEWGPSPACDVVQVFDTEDELARWYNESYLVTQDVTGAMSHDYSNMTAEHCEDVNFDVLLMEGYLCHVRLPEPCLNGGR